MKSPSRESKKIAKILEKHEFALDGGAIKLKLFEINISSEPLSINRTGIGVDPGSKNFGVALLCPDSDVAHLVYCRLQKPKDFVHRMLLVQRGLEQSIEASHTEITHNPRISAVIEGASYGARYGQVELAEARAAAALWLHGRGVMVKIIPPKSVRKLAWGNGGIINPYSNLPDDCAAALGCAIVAAA